MKKKKESLYIRVVRRMYGIQGNFDEYKEQELNKIGNKSFMILAGYTMISAWVALLAMSSSLDKEITFFSYIASNFLVLMAIFGYIVIKTSKLKLDQVEVYDDKQYDQLMKKTKKGLLHGFFFFFVMTRILTIIMNLVDAHNSRSLLDLIWSPKDNIQWLIASIFFTVAMYIFTKTRIKKEK